MGLSNDLISQFAKITKDDKQVKNESTVYGTVVEQGGSQYVRLDGSDLLTPVTLTTNVVDGERVTVMIKNHTATVTGNTSSPSARGAEVKSVLSGVGNNRSYIEQLIEKISMLVVGEDGSTLWEQTDSGWSFNFSDVTDRINSSVKDVDDLKGLSDTLNKNINEMKPSIRDFDAINPYIRFITVVNSSGFIVPCIELGSNDSPFKVQITNEEIRFMEESSRVAYINNQTLNIGKANINDEFRIGGLVWKKRNNGNVGLLWEG